MNWIKKITLLLLLFVSYNLFGQFASEFNYTVSDTPTAGGEFQLRGIFSNVEKLGDPDYTESDVAVGQYFIDSEGQVFLIHAIVNVSPLYIEVNNIGANSFTPELGIGQLTTKNSTKNQFYVTSGIGTALKAKIERLNIDSLVIGTSLDSTNLQDNVLRVRTSDDSLFLIDLAELTYDFNRLSYDITSRNIGVDFLQSTTNYGYKLVDEVPSEFNNGVADSIFYIPVNLTDTVTNLAYYSEALVEDNAPGFSLYAGNAVKNLTERTYKGSPTAEWTGDGSTGGRLFFRTNQAIGIGDTIKVSFDVRTVYEDNVTMQIQGGGGGSGQDIVTEPVFTAGREWERKTFDLIANSAEPSNANRFVDLRMVGTVELTRVSISLGGQDAVYYKTLTPTLNSDDLYAEFIPENGVIEMARLPLIKAVTDDSLYIRVQEFANYTETLNVLPESRIHLFSNTLEIKENIHIDAVSTNPSQVWGNDVEPNEYSTVFKFINTTPINCIDIIQPDGNPSSPHNNSSLKNVTVWLTDTVTNVLRLRETNGVVIDINVYQSTASDVMADTIASQITTGPSDAYSNHVSINASRATGKIGYYYEGKSIQNSHSGMFFNRSTEAGILVTAGTFECDGCVIQASSGITVDIQGGKGIFKQLYTESSDSTVIRANNAQVILEDCVIQTDNTQKLFDFTNGSSMNARNSLLKQSSLASFDSTTLSLNFENIGSLDPVYLYDFGANVLELRSNIDNYDLNTGEPFPSYKKAFTTWRSTLKEAGLENPTITSLTAGQVNIRGKTENRLINSFRVGDGGTENINAGGADNIVIESLAANNQFDSLNTASKVYFTGEDIGDNSTQAWFSRSYDNTDIQPGDFYVFSVYVKPTPDYPTNTPLFIFRPGALEDQVEVSLPANLPTTLDSSLVDNGFTRISIRGQFDESSAGDIDGLANFRIYPSEGSEWGVEDTIYIGSMSFVTGYHPVGHVETSGTAIVNEEVSFVGSSVVNFEGGLTTGENKDEVINEGNVDTVLKPLMYATGIETLDGNSGDQSVVVTPGIGDVTTCIITYGVEGDLSYDPTELVAIITNTTATTFTISLLDALDATETVKIHWKVTLP